MLCILWHALLDFVMHGTVELRNGTLHKLSMHMRLLTLTSLVTSRLSLLEFWTVTE